MKPRRLTSTAAMALFAALAALLLLGFSASAQAVRGVTTYNGTFSDGATYLIEVPRDWNGTLLLYSHGYPFPDSAFAFNTLLVSGSGIQVVNITNPDANLGIAAQVIANAQATPQGRARIALAAALIDSPGWTSDPFGDPVPEPSPTDYATQEANQFTNLLYEDFQFFFALRAELESRAGGNPSWNTEVDYKKQL